MTFQEQRKTAKIIADLFFAYINKDEEKPHDFELQALEEALYYLQEHYHGDKYNIRGFEDILNEIHDK